MHRYTLCTNLLFGSESPTGKKISRLQAEVPSGRSCTLSVYPSLMQSQIFFLFSWSLRGPRVWQAQGLNVFPLVEACLCQGAHGWQWEPGTNRSNSCWSGFFLIYNYNSTCRPSYPFEWEVGGDVKEAGSFKSVIFHFDSALGSRKKEPFAPKVQRLYQPKKKKKEKKGGM